MYKGNYFDGFTSQNHNCNLTIYNDHLAIDIENQSQVIWYYQKINKNYFLSDEKTVLRYGEFPQQIIEVFDKEFLKEIEKFLLNKTIPGFLYKMIENRKRLLILAIATFSLVLSIYFFVIPFSAEIIAGYIPYKDEKTFGDSLTKILFEKFPIDDEKTIYLNQFLKELKLPDQKDRKIDVNIKVIKNPEVNAYAVMGGTIIVNEGILDTIHSYDELAALIGHEYIHIYKKHSSKAIFRSLANYVVISYLFNDYSGIFATILQSGDTLNNLRYSRSKEKEADIEGSDILMLNNISPEAMISLMKELKKVEEIKDSNFFSNIFSTHDYTDQRIKYLKEYIRSHKNTIIKSNEKLKIISKNILGGIQE